MFIVIGLLIQDTQILNERYFTDIVVIELKLN